MIGSDLVNPSVPVQKNQDEKENRFPSEGSPHKSLLRISLPANKPELHKKYKVKKLALGTRSMYLSSKKVGFANKRNLSSTSLCSMADSDTSYISVSVPEAQEHVFAPMISLINKFPKPTLMYLCRDDDDQITPRCIAAVSALKSAALAASARNGIPGILDLLVKKFTWGPTRASKKHEVMQQREIDCGAQMNIAYDLLSLAPDVVDGKVILVKVQIIRR